MATMAWVLTTEGLASRIDDGDGTNIRETIEIVLGTDLITYIEIVPGVSLWVSMVARLWGQGLNAAALGAVDILLDLECSVWPRIHGDVVIASHTDQGEPASIGYIGMRAIRDKFAV